jgi:hypothetical protein
MTLRHLPTGIEVEGRTESGHSSRKEMQHLMEELRVRLWPELERLVAVHLRIPGR